MMGADPEVSGYPSSLPTVGFYYIAGLPQYSAPSPNTACSNGASVHKFGGSGFIGSGSGVGLSACTVTRTSDGSTFTTAIEYLTSACPSNYTKTGTTCTLNGNPAVHVPTSADWDSKQSLLNDSRFVPELNEKGIPLPTSGIPMLNTDQKKRLGVESTPTKDSQGNVTGRQETVTEIEAVDAGTTDKPGKVIIKETVTKIQYDNNNTQISSNTSTSYSSQPQTENKPQTFEIKFDEVPPA